MCKIKHQKTGHFHGKPEQNSYATSRYRPRALSTTAFDEQVESSWNFFTIINMFDSLLLKKN